MRLTTFSLLAGILSLAVPALSTKSGHASSSDSTSSALSTDSDQICPSSDPASCYPRIFVPTIDFQPVLEGQSIPPGLHIRLNVQTGFKEARLNVPMEGAAEDETIETVFAGEGSDVHGEPGSAVLEVPQPDAREELK